MFGEDSFVRRHKVFTALGVLLGLILLLAVWVYTWRFGPHHGYTLDFLVPAGGKPAEQPGQLQVGVAKRDVTINADLYDTWTDGNNNSMYDIWPDMLRGWQKPLFSLVNKSAKVFDPAKAAQSGDSYVDRNHNGYFDPVWIAGFNSNRPAKGIHDPQWVRAIALRNNGVTVVMVTIDAIGIYENEYIDVRKKVNPALKVDHIIFSSTHCHEVPDTMKIWGGIPLINPNTAYLKTIKDNAVSAIEEAVAALQPADMFCATAELPAEGFIHDSRRPVVMDTNAYLWQFTRPNSKQTIATLVNWGNHPEALGGDNGLLSSDFPNWLRLGMESGVPEPNGAPGLGGMCLYFQGMVGGLMNPLHIKVPTRDGKQFIEEDSFEKAENLGYNVALRALAALRGPAAWKNDNPYLAVAGKTIMAPMEGMFKWAMTLGFMHEGVYGGNKSRTEVNALRIGDVVVSTVPGELYSEVAIGGIEAKPGRDYEIPPVEVPPYNSEGARLARQFFTIGLANDEIGYIIPKTQWDVKAPYVYEKSQYGEQNSGGPDVAGAVHGGTMEMLKRINETFGAAPAKAPAASGAVPATPAPAPAP